MFGLDGKLNEVRRLKHHSRHALAAAKAGLRVALDSWAAAHSKNGHANNANRAITEPETVLEQLSPVTQAEPPAEITDQFSPEPASSRPTPTSVPDGMTAIDFYRFEATKAFLRGKGIEIGAGANPQHLPDGATCEYYDIRTTEQLAVLFKSEIKYDVRSVDEVPSRYPGGVDFLIAHNVIEHSSDPIGLLKRFQSYVRDGGTLVISLPFMEVCPDDQRLAAPLEHLVLDHILERGDDAFESREHIYSFLLGWVDHIWLQGETQKNYARFLLSEARRNGHDLHWHAFDTMNAMQIIEAACRLDGIGAELLAWMTPDTEPATSSDIIGVYRINRKSRVYVGFNSEVVDLLVALHERLSRAISALHPTVKIRRSP